MFNGGDARTPKPRCILVVLVAEGTHTVEGEVGILFLRYIPQNPGLKLHTT